MFHWWRQSICVVIYCITGEILFCLSEKLFRRRMLIVTSGVEFSFDDIIFRQIDGVAMESPLGPVLADILFGFVGHESPMLNISHCVVVSLMIVRHALRIKIVR